VQVHMRRLLKEDRSRHREASPGKKPAARNARNLPTSLFQRRQRKRQGRVTDAPAHMPETLSKTRCKQEVCDAGLFRKPVQGGKVAREGTSSPYSSVACWTVWLPAWICTH
jgi:hypothetical protein